MAKQSSLIKRQELKRDKLVAKFAAEAREQLKAISNDVKLTDEERFWPPQELQKLPRNANPTRQRNRCEYHGSPAWHVPSIRSGSRQDS